MNRCYSLLRRTAPRRREAGFTLVELLLASLIAGLVLSSAWAWLWNVAGVAARTGERAQAVTIAAAAARSVTTDVRCAVGAASPASGHDPARSLALLSDALEEAADEVTLVWDPARRVLWRNATGTYLADHVTAFAVSYVLADGSPVPGADMTSADWSSVRLVSIELTVTVGSAVISRSFCASVGLL
jgi:prepilin-type N-terminal cleavage/methylation domain-containing protein